MSATLRPVFAAALLFLHAAAAQDVVVEKVEGQDGFALSSALVTDLSGLVWTGGDSYYAVSDKENLLVPLTLHIDLATGQIARGEIGAAIPVPSDASDMEGVTYCPGEKAFYISCETGHTVVRFVPGQPRAKTMPVPPVFAHARKNLSLESITWDDTAKQFWIANEEALLPDGPVSSPALGTLVRLQRLDAKFNPTAQYAWRTEPAPFRFQGAGNGVSDLCVLPDGHLLVLERGFGTGGLRLRLFLADFTDATDTSKLPALEGATVTPARKIPLYDVATGLANFEGLALGPKLADGTRSLILIADSNGTPNHAFLPLKVRFPEKVQNSGSPAKGSAR